MTSLPGQCIKRIHVVLLFVVLVVGAGCHGPGAASEPLIGITSVYKAGGAFEKVAENDLGEYTLASPAVSRGQIFIRTAEHLYCIGSPGAR